MVNGKDGGGHEPGDTQDGVDDDTDSHDQQVQVIATTFLNINNIPQSAGPGDSHHPSEHT